MKYTITGEIAQRVRVEVEPGQFLWASKGSLVAYSDQIDWRLKVPGGLGGTARRMLSGEGLALNHISTPAADQYVVLAANEPGHVTPWDLADGAVLTTRGSFLAAWGPDVDISVTVARRAGAALFGGAGLFLQRISGAGTVLIHGSGDFEELRLEPGEKVLVSSGNLAAFSDSVDYDVQGVGGCRKIFFSGEGLFMTRLVGPGRVLLQTLKRRFGKSKARTQ